MKPSQKVFVAIGTIAVVGLAVVGGKVLYSGDSLASDGSGMSSSSSSSTQSSVPTSSAPSTSGTSGSTASSGSYKDGTYTATQSYFVPHGGSNSVKVTLTVANGKISAVTTNDQYTDGESSFYVNSFESSVSSDASGQSLGDYSPSRIGGASLTTEAFAQAVDTIRTQAAA